MQEKAKLKRLIDTFKEEAIQADEEESIEEFSSAIY